MGKIPPVPPAKKQGGRRPGAGRKPDPARQGFVNLAVRIPAPLKRALDASAAAAGVTIAERLRQMLEASLAGEDRPCV